MQVLEDLHGNELFAHLRANKKQLVAQKMAALKFSDPVAVKPEISKVRPKQKTTATKSDSTPEGEDETGVINVKVVCNTAWFIDSHRDVIVDTAFDKSINDKGATIPHLLDHTYSCTAHVGDVKKLYKQQIPLVDLGLDQPGMATALIMETAVREDYNDKVFKFYSTGKINQHSIGFRCLDIRMAMNSEYIGDKEEKAVWDAFYPRVINKEKADERGYFWVITEIDLLENSCVLFGANPLTPTLSTETKTLIQESKVTDEHVKQLIAGFALATKEAVKEAVAPLAEQVKTLGDKEPVKIDFSSLENSIKSALVDAVNPVLAKSQDATAALNFASDCMKALADKVIAMPSPYNKSAPNIYGVAGDKPEDETFAI